MRKLLIAAAVAFVTAGCVTYDLSGYRFADRPMAVEVRIAPNARVDADYFVRVDANDPIGSVLSIGTSVAKAGEVAAAQERMNRAMEITDVRAITRDELESFVEFSLGSIVVARRPDADFYLRVEIEQYGIDTDSPGGGVQFRIDGRASLYDELNQELIWASSLRVREVAHPSFFGLPAAVGNVMSAAYLAEMSEEDIARGLDTVARAAANEIAERIETSIYQ